MSSCSSASSEPATEKVSDLPTAGEASMTAHIPNTASESSLVSSPAEAHACCAQGTLHAGKTAGFETKLAGLNVYVVHPTGAGSALSADAPPRTAAVGGSALVLLHDMFGWKLPNSRLLADRFASSLGVTVYLPDFFSGEQLHPADWDHLVAERKGFFSKVAQGFQFMVALPKLLSFMKRHGAPVVRPHMDRFLAHLRAAEGAQRIGAIGYCWGGRYAVLLTHPQAAASPASAAAAPESVAAAGGAGAPAKEAPAAAVPAQRPAVDVAVSCHPSLLEMPAEIAPAAAPILFVCAEKDDLFTPAAVAAAKRVADARSKAAPASSSPSSSSGGSGAGATAGATTPTTAGSAGAPISFAHYPGTRHGFAVRGDDSDPAIAAARQKAFDDAVAFMRPVLAVHAASSASTAAPLLPAAAVDAAAGTVSAGASVAAASPFQR